MACNISKIKNFLSQNFLKKYTITSLEQDASLRKYYRIETKQHSYILMDSSADHQALRNFIKISNLLKKYEFSVPEIILADLSENILVIEDFGNISFNKYLKLNPSQSDKFYKLALDNLLEIAKIKISDIELNCHNLSELMLGINLLEKYYLKQKTEKLTIIAEQIIKQLDFKFNYLVLRDFHADNLMILNNRENYHQIGILDYQDASKGFLAYDLVSLTQDARCFVSLAQQKRYFNYFAEKLKIKNLSDFRKEYDILSFQRNARILGLFAKFKSEGKNNYTQYIKNVEKYFYHSLNSPYLTPIKNYLNKL